MWQQMSELSRTISHGKSVNEGEQGGGTRMHVREGMHALFKDVFIFIYAG